MTFAFIALFAVSLSQTALSATTLRSFSADSVAIASASNLHGNSESYVMDAAAARSWSGDDSRTAFTALANESVDIAKMEIQNRPTPHSFDLLAWGLYHQGNFSQALEVAQQNVEGQTFEPDAYYHLGRIYLANGNRRKSKQYLEEALKSEFELGPSVTRDILEALNTL